MDGVHYGAIEAALDRVQGSNVWLTFAMREGKNREIRNVLRALGLQVNRLIRVSFGPFQLGELPDGAVEEVKTRTLREQLGPRLAALSGADFSSEIVEREEPRTSISPRHPEVRAKRASKGDGPEGRSASKRPRVVAVHPSRAGCAGHLRMTGRRQRRASTSRRRVEDEATPAIAG